MQGRVFLGTDGGATTSKTAAVWEDGSPVSMTLLQRPTGGEHGPGAVVAGWTAGATDFLSAHGLSWDRVGGVGVAVPGPRRSYGVLDSSPNLPGSFSGFDILTDYSAALAAAAGRPIPLFIGNDGNLGGVAEARIVRGDSRATVVMLAPGSGLGAAYVGPDGLPLDGDTLSGMEAGHMPAPLQVLGVPPYRCGCGREWGCVEVYTTLAGLPYLLAEELAKEPRHPLAAADLTPKQKALALRDLARDGDALAQRLFDFQARALGLHVASLAMALDPEYVVIGGGLMDPHSTTAEFRRRYLDIVRTTADPYLWPPQRAKLKIVPAALGELSQAIGAALVAMYASRRA